MKGTKKFSRSCRPMAQGNHVPFSQGGWPPDLHLPSNQGLTSVIRLNLPSFVLSVRVLQLPSGGRTQQENWCEPGRLYQRSKGLRRLAASRFPEIGGFVNRIHRGPTEGGVATPGPGGIQLITPFLRFGPSNAGTIIPLESFVSAQEHQPGHGVAFAPHDRVLLPLCSERARVFE